VDFYVSPGPPSSYRMNSFTFEPGGKVILQDQYGLSRFVSGEVPFFDGTVDGVVTALGQFSRFVHCYKFVQHHFPHASLVN
ncbi:MAG: hypothetical protein U9R66_06915, partial [Thermodesulfobacteriota bacterium]|nr:hypothetical protein [Thermodesulfobacteriota bacterium]